MLIVYRNTLTTALLISIEKKKDLGDHWTLQHFVLMTINEYITLDQLPTEQNRFSRHHSKQQAFCTM